jgi:hypothetical protein
MNLEEMQAQVAEQQASLEQINSARRRLADAEARHTEARRAADDAANELRRLETENPRLHELNQVAGFGHESPPSSDGEPINGQDLGLVNAHLSAN